VLVIPGEHASHKLESIQLQLRNILNKEGRHSKGGEMKHRGVREQLDPEQV